MFTFGRIPFNFPFLKKDGSISTIGDEINAGGGGEPYVLPTASAETKGGVKIGAGLTMTGEVLSNNNPTPYTLPTASAETKGGVKIGAGLTMTDDVLSNNNPTPYTLPTASADTKGGVKVGSGLSIDENGVLSASGGGGSNIQYATYKGDLYLSSGSTNVILSDFNITIPSNAIILSCHVSAPLVTGNPVNGSYIVGNVFYRNPFSKWAISMCKVGSTAFDTTQGEVGIAYIVPSN